MRACFTLVPIAAVAIVAPAHATVYMSVEQAQTLMFPGATLTPDHRVISKEEKSAIEKAAGIRVRNQNLKAWKVSTGGWFIADEVIGKHDVIPFALALDAEGAVKSVEILEYRESYGGQVRGQAWRAQFTGKANGAPLSFPKDIKNISGATLSVKHVTDGIRRLLATHDIVLDRD
jgi:FMN-binding domain